MRKLAIPTLSSKVLTEIKNAFQAIQLYFNLVNEQGGVATTDEVLSTHYTKAQVNQLLANSPKWEAGGDFTVEQIMTSPQSAEREDITGLYWMGG